MYTMPTDTYTLILTHRIYKYTHAHIHSTHNMHTHICTHSQSIYKIFTHLHILYDQRNIYIHKHIYILELAAMSN